MTIRNSFDIEALRKIGHIVAETLELMKSSLEEGITTLELDAIAEANFRKYRAVSAPRKVYGFPGSTCISVNEAVAHGIPSKRKIRKGDVVNMDVSAELDGYFADTGFTVAFENGSRRIGALCECSRRALEKGIAEAKPGRKLNLVGRAIEREAERNGFTTLRNLTGHGTGSALHEYPDHIYNYYEPKQKEVFAEGMVVAIETFVSTGADFAEDAGDGWTLTTADRSFVAQYEHSLIVTGEGPVILTQVMN